MVDSTLLFETAKRKIIGHRLEEASKPARRSHRENWQPVYGERSQVVDHFNELTLNLVDTATKFGMNVTLRCYDSGVAFQTVLQAKDGQAHLVVEGERAEFVFLSDHTTWAAVNAQGKCRPTPISELPNQTERPLVIEVDNETYVALGEAALVDYARMKYAKSPNAEHSIRGVLASKVHSEGSLATPWRVIMLADSPGELLENNDIFLNLNGPCAIEDTSWIKPGKVLREITLTNAGARACMDFAKRHDFSYIEFDAGWYGHEYDEASDATTISLDPARSAGPFDLKHLIQEANAKNIGVIVYVNRRALETQLDELLPLYKEWGIAGVKYGFVQVGSQKWTKWLHSAVRKAADHRLMVDIHDEYRPTGYSRTYPNLMTQEGVRGDEATPSTEQVLTTLFTRSLAGATDHTVCYFDERVDEHWTHAHQLAKGVCFYSPWQFLYWYDTPLQDAGTLDSIVDTPELEFFGALPTTWDDTKVLHGSIGEYAVVTRRSGTEWFVGALTNGTPRSLPLRLDFLDESTSYVAHTYSDDPSSGTVTNVAIDRLKVNSTDTLMLRLLANGGQALRIVPTDIERSAANTEVSNFE